MEPKYRVRLYIDNTYEVVEEVLRNDETQEASLFQGSLSDCEAFIRLRESGYM